MATTPNKVITHEVRMSRKRDAAVAAQKAIDKNHPGKFLVIATAKGLVVKKL